MSTEAGLEKLEKIVSSLLGDSLHTEAQLRECIEEYRGIAAPSADDKDIERLVKKLSNKLLIVLDLGDAITSKDFRSWLPEQKHSIDWQRWKVYKQWMLNQGRPPKVMDTMDQLTDTILDFVGDPKREGQWARRGLVV